MGSRHFCEYSFPEQVSQTDFCWVFQSVTDLVVHFYRLNSRYFFCFKTKCRARNQKPPLHISIFSLVTICSDNKET